MEEQAQKLVDATSKFLNSQIIKLALTLFKFNKILAAAFKSGKINPNAAMFPPRFAMPPPMSKFGFFR